jgi:F-type H+-transporting ATPase subunit b
MTFDFWTLGFQAVNVLVLVWLLQRFFWKPVAATISARQAAAATLLDDAQAQKTKAEAALAEVDATRAALAAEPDALLAEARKDADAARDAVLQTARAEAEALHDTAKAARVRAAETLKASAMADAQGLALTIAGRLLARLGPAATDAAFLGWLVDGIASLPEADRKALGDAALKVISATPQDSAAQDAIAKALATALGHPATLTFHTDPDLIAGHELHSPHFTLRNSWAADLARIKQAIATPAPDGGLSDAA